MQTTNKMALVGLLLLVMIDSTVAQTPNVVNAKVQETSAAGGLKPDSLVLGCTHYPLLRPLIERAVPEGMKVIDSAESTAEAAARLFNGRAKPRHADETGCPILTGSESSDSVRAGSDPPPASGTEIRCFATDSVEKFERLGSRFLGRPTGNVQLVDLGG